MAMKDKDAFYMRLALELARQGEGYTAPNPMVGAVIVKDDRIIGQGYHKKYGELHAERHALANCAESPKGATIYVTLEPCCHYGKQPPCVEAIVAAGISRVVVGAPDPNPLVAGKGIAFLRQNGIIVEENVFTEECLKINTVFFHFIKTGTPYVVMKYAMTLDGKIATATGESQWITGEEARKYVHRQRHKYSAIMVGVGTVLADDPLLTCRLAEGKNPIRIVCDSQLRTPLAAQVIKTAKEVPTILATCCMDREKQQSYLAQGCRVITTPVLEGHVDLPFLMKQLGREGIDSIFLEGGATLSWSALKSGIVQKVQAYIAPKLVGGAQAKSPIGGIGFSALSESVSLENCTVTPLGLDFCVEGVVRNHVYRNC